MTQLERTNTIQRSGWPVALTLLVAGMMTSAGSALAQSNGPASGDQASVYESTCAPCHGNPATRGPTRESLHAMSPDFVVSALTDGLMKDMGAGLSPQQRVALAEFLTDHKVGEQTAMAGHCAGSQPPLSTSGPAFNGWGVTVANLRYQPEPGLGGADLPKLKVAWAFGVPGVVAMFGQPTIAGGRVFFGTQSGHVYSLDALTGCYYWDYQASAGVRTAITVARIGNREVALFGDRRGHAYSVDAATGKAVWKVTVVAGPHLGVTGAPTLFEGKLYVPINGGDDSAAIDPKYECCKGRGEVAALDAETGEIIWQTYTIPDATPQWKNPVGTQLWGPSGASVWSSPTIDTKLHALYVGTGDNHSAPATDESDAVLAIALDSGKVLWAHQLLAGDMGNASCFSAEKVNCPEPHGPDYDLGATGNLVTLPGDKRVLTIGQKSGMVWALDPDDKGRIVWQRRVGAGGVLGGVQWGTASDGKAIYAAVSDLRAVSLQPIILDPATGGGLHALLAATGAELWTAPPAKGCDGRKNCSPAQSAAVTATSEFVLSGSIDGHMRAYGAADGRVLWDFDTERSFTTTNGVAASGGSIDAAGPTIAGGMIFLGSGYGLYGGQPGNVLIAFAVAP
jgi:polyvinyl alcohol dehydrogenase (cytochrome)